MKKLLFVGMACAFGSAAFAQQLVTNGQMEVGGVASDAGWTLQGASAGSDQFVSTATTGDPGNAQYGATTDAWFAGATSGIDDVLYQTIATTAGHNYTFVVNYYNESASTETGWGMDVWWNTSTFTTGGGNVFTLTNGGATQAWTSLSFNVMATGSSTVIAIGGYNGPTFTQMSDVGVEAASTPEPASMAVLGLGALALIRRRRNRS